MFIVLLFLVLILSILFTIEPTHLTKSYSRIFKKHDETSINLANVFDIVFNVFLIKPFATSEMELFVIKNR